MDFSVDINKLFREDVTLIDNRLEPCRQHGIDRYGFQQLQKMLYEVVDKMGDASAKAQGLHGSITTGKKLELANHRLYLMKDANGNGGRGSVLGILKVGHKKLFVYDHCKVQHELEPLCILDFYVHESRQRMGCGRKLFDFMLSRENIPVEHLAIDRPSPKFLSFLNKHYCLQTVIPQVNNFVIFDNFFNNRGYTRNVRNNDGRRGLPLDTFNQNANPMRPSSGHKAGISPYNEANHVQAQAYRQQQSQSSERSWTPSMARQSPSHMGAGEMMYSRHRATPPLSGRSTPNQRLRGNATRTPTQGHYPPQKQQQQQQQRQNHYQQQQQAYQEYHHQPQHQQQQQQQHQQYRQQHQQYWQQQTFHGSQISNNNNKDDANSVSFYKHLNAQSSPSTYYTMGTSLGNYQHGAGGNNILEHLPPKAPSQAQRQVAGSSFSTPNFGQRGRREGNDVADTYSPPHQNATRAVSGNTLPPPPPPPPSGAAPPSFSPNPAGPVVNGGNDLHLATPAQPAQQENHPAYRPPSGKQSGSNIRRGTTQPPILQRDGPPSNYKDMLNMHHTYQGRNGHLNIPNGTTAVTVPGNPLNPPPTYSRPEHQNTSWTVTGVLREQRLNAPMSNRFYNPTRLW